MRAFHFQTKEQLPLPLDTSNSDVFVFHFNKWFIDSDTFFSLFHADSILKSGNL